MKECGNRKRMRRRAGRALLIIAAMATLTACALIFRPQTAGTQVDPDNIVFLTKKNMGNISLKNETIWFRCEINNKYCGHQKWKIENKGGQIRFGMYVKYDYKAGDYYEHVTAQDDLILQQGSLLPISEKYKLVNKSFKTYFRNEKTIDYDWRGNSITVTRGDENKKQSRKIMIKEDAVGIIAVLYSILDKDKLVPGKTYRFYSFLSGMETITMQDILVTSEIKENVYELSAYLPTSFGTSGIQKIWVSPRSEKNPNGEIQRIDSGALLYTKTTEAKALNKQAGKQKKEKE